MLISHPYVYCGWCLHPRIIDLLTSVFSQKTPAEVSRLSSEETEDQKEPILNISERVQDL